MNDPAAKVAGEAQAKTATNCEARTIAFGLISHQRLQHLCHV